MNDLIGLKYRWGCGPTDGSGYTDCFQLLCVVRKRMGFFDYTDRFAWVYGEYDEQTFPRLRIARWLLQLGVRLPGPVPGAVALLPGHAGAALGIVTEHGLLFIAPGQNVVHAPIPPGMGRFFWID